MKYAVQFVEPKFFGVTEVTVDTPPISKEEALKIYEECRERFCMAFNNGLEAQLVVWEDVGDGEFPIYHRELVCLDTRDDLIMEGGKFYERTVTEIKEPNAN